MFTKYLYKSFKMYGLEIVAVKIVKYKSVTILINLLSTLSTLSKVVRRGPSYINNPLK
jgi:hypothetical protein